MSVWNFGTRVIDGLPSGFIVRDERDNVVAIIPKNPPRTQATCEAIAREITRSHNGGSYVD